MEVVVEGFKVFLNFCCFWSLFFLVRVGVCVIDGCGCEVVSKVL